MIKTELHGIEFPVLLTQLDGCMGYSPHMGEGQEFDSWLEPHCTYGGFSLNGCRVRIPADALKPLMETGWLSWGWLFSLERFRTRGVMPWCEVIHHLFCFLATVAIAPAEERRRKWRPIFDLLWFLRGDVIVFVVVALEVCY
ncbi:hypothetical protein Tco_0186298 [Tanacetum coccineum]